MVNFAAVNVWPVVSVASLGIDQTSVANTAGNALMAFLDAGSSYSDLPVFNVADDANNWWIPAGRQAFGDRQLEIWVAPNARAADFVSVGSSWPSQAVTGQIVEFTGFPDFASVNVSASNSTPSGTSLSLTAAATAATFGVSMFAVSDLGSTPSVTGPGGSWAPNVAQGSLSTAADPSSQTIAFSYGTFGAGSVSASWGQANPGAPTGAFLDSAGMNTASITAAIALWQSWTGITLSTIRDYSNGPSDFVFHPRYTSETAAGQKLCLDLLPAYNPVSATDLASLNTLLSSMKAAGIDAEISLWHEPFFNGLSAAQYIAMIQYYGPTVRQYYPLVFVTSLSSVIHNNENSYYPGDAWVDKVATDYYAINYENGFLLDAAATIADNAVPPKPFGIWEFNALVSGANFLVQPNSGFEGSTGTWTNAGNCTIADSSAQAHTGADSLALTSAAAGNMAAANCLAANIATQGMQCSPGDSIQSTTWFRAATTARSVQAAVAFYDSSGTSLGTLTGTAIADSTTGWTQATATVTAPAGAAHCRAMPGVLAAGAAGEVHYVDDVLLSNLTAGFSSAQVTSFFSYIQSYFASRANSGKQNADILVFNGTGPNSSEIVSSSDFRIPLIVSNSAQPSAELAALTVCFTQAPVSPFQPNPNRPALKVEAAFGFKPGVISAVPAWTDITTYCIAEDGTQGITTSRGREYELTEAEAGEITILVNNLDGTFNPENTASVFWPNVTLEVPVRVSAVWNNVTYPIAFGYITSLPQQFPDPQWGFVPIRANDGVSILSNITMPSALGGEILADGPYLYIPFTEFYNAAAGEPFDNASRTNLKAAVGYNGNLDANVLQTGLTLNLAGDPGTGIGIDGLSSSSITRLPGARYLDYDLPAPANGCTLEIAAVVGLPPSGTTYLNLLALEGPAGNYFPVSSINQPAAPPYAQPNWRMGLVLTQDHAATNGYNLFIQGFAQSTFQHSGTASVSFMDGNPHWHSVTLNWNGSNWVVAYYIDGNQQFSATTSGVGQFGRVNAITTGPCQTYCATTNVGGYNYATGQLAYTGAVLSQARIQAHATAALTGFSGDIVSERFARHLTWAGLGLPRAGDAGSSSPLIGHADQVQGQSVADAANDLVTDDGGMWYSDAQGNNWIRSRQSLYNKNTRWIFGDNPSAGECPYEPDAEFGFDNSFLYNQTSSVRTISTGNEYLVAGNGAADKVTVNNTGAIAQAADLASEQQYFPHGPLEQDIETTSDQDSYDRANWSLVKYRQPVIRASKITLSPASNPAVWPVALGVEQGDIALVNRRPIGAVPYSVLCIVQKVEHSIEPSNWTVDVTLAPYFPDNTVLQASITSFDALASPNVLGW